MKIVHLIADFSQLGGAEAMLIRFANATSDKHVHHVISLMSASDDILSRLSPDIKVTVLGGTNIFDIIFSIFPVSREFKSQHMDSVYCWMYHSNVIGAVARILSRKSVNLIWGVHHSLDSYSTESLKTKISLWIGRSLRKQATKVIFCSSKSLEQHVEFGYAKPEQSVYVPNGYDFQTTALKKIIKKPFVLGAAGRFHPAKNYSMFFAVISKIKLRYPDTRIVIAGRGMTPENPDLISLLEKNNVNVRDVTLLGNVREMESFYKMVDFFLLTSTTEGFPNVLPEASSMGCICFTTNVGDAPLIIQDRSRIVSVDDVDGMVEKICLYFTMSPDLLRDYSSKSSSQVRDKYNIYNIAETYLSVATSKSTSVGNR